MTDMTATDPLSSPWEAALLETPDAVARLAEILGLEFEALKVRDLNAFEAIHPGVCLNVKIKARFVAQLRNSLKIN